MKSSGFKDAPPTSTPSTFGIVIMLSALEPFTLAPYKTGVSDKPMSDKMPKGELQPDMG